MSGSASLILAYHSVDTSGSVISTSPQTFREQMKFLAGSGLRVAPLAEVQQTPGAVALTFDDGFLNFFEHAFPALQEHDFPATVFVVAGYCGGRNDWPSQWPGIPKLELMTWGQLQEIARHGVALGGHTVNHPPLTSLPMEQIETELRECRAVIEDRTGHAAEAFAYPYGDSNENVRACTARHFSLACGTSLAYLSPQSSRFDLPRLDAFYLQKRCWFERLATPAGRAYIALRRRLREWRQLVTR